MTGSDGNLAIVLGGGSRVLGFSHSPGGEGTLPGMDTSSPQPSPGERGDFFGGCWHFAVTLTLNPFPEEEGISLALTLERESTGGGGDG